MSKLDGIKTGDRELAAGDKAIGLGCLEGVIIGKASNGYLVMEYAVDAVDDLDGGLAFLIRDPSCFTHA